MFAPVADKTIKGDYIETMLERHEIPDTTMESPEVVQMALVFVNKTSG